MENKQNCQFKWPIAGHSNIVSYLQKNIETNKVSQAYLFTGPNGLGKKMVAQYFVRSLLCENNAKKENQIPCAQCKTCQQVNNNIHPDIYWLTRQKDEKKDKLKKNISIEQIRELQGKLGLHSFLNSYKIAVIEEAETLNKEAANSLLKTLEEPTKKTVIILLTSNLNYLPQTIISRCQVLRFLPVNNKEIIEFLKSQGSELKKAKQLSSVSFGRPGIALSYLTNQEVYEDFLQQIKNFMSLAESDINSRFKLLNDFVEFNNPGKIKEVFNIWNRIIRDLFFIKIKADNLVSSQNLLKSLSSIADKYSRQELSRLMKEVNISKKYIDSNVNPRLVLENLVLNF